MRQRTVRVDDERWAAWGDAAWAMRLDVSELIRRATDAAVAAYGRGGGGASGVKAAGDGKNEPRSFISQLREKAAGVPLPPPEEAWKHVDFAAVYEEEEGAGTEGGDEVTDEQEARTQAQGDVPAEQAVGFARRGHAKTQRVQETAAQASRGQREGQQDAERAHPSGGRARLPEPNPTGGAFRPFLKQDQIRKPKK